MLRFTLFMCFLGLFACQSPHVYLVAKGIEKGLVQDVQQSFQNAGYDVTLTDIEIPIYLSDAAISVSPVLDNSKILTDIQSVLRREGFSYISVYQLAEGNHRYTKSNIGVYLRGQGYKPMPPVMSAEVCNSVTATVEFFPENDFTLEIELSSELSIFTGVYSRVDDDIRLAFANGATQTYSLKSTQIKTAFGYKEAVLMDLLFQSTKILPANCQFITIYG